MAHRFDALLLALACGSPMMTTASPMEPKPMQYTPNHNILRFSAINLFSELYTLVFLCWTLVLDGCPWLLPFPSSPFRLGKTKNASYPLRVKAISFQLHTIKEKTTILRWGREARHVEPWSTPALEPHAWVSRTNSNLGPSLTLVLVVVLHEVGPHGAVVARGRRGYHGSRLHAVAQLDRLRAERGRVVQVAAALGQLGEELGALAESGGPADGADILPEDCPADGKKEMTGYFQLQ